MTLQIVKVGGWALNEILESDQMNDLQDELIKAVDGVDGGAYTLSADLSFDGVGEVQILNTLRVDSGAVLELDGQTNFNGTSDFFGDQDFISGGITTFFAGHDTFFQDLDDLQVDSDEHTYRVPLMWGQSQTNGSVPYWEVFTDGWLCTNVSSSALLFFSLPMMAGDVLSELFVAVTAGSGAGHGGTDPTNKMRFRLLEASSIDTAWSAIVTAVHPGTLATYDGAVEFDIFLVAAASPLTVLDRQYFIEVRSENGGTAANNENLVRGFKAVITRNKLASTNVLGA